MGSLTLASPDPEKRLKAAQDVFTTRDAKALPALQAQLAKESDPARRRRPEARPSVDLRDQRQRLAARPSCRDCDAEGARRSGRAKPHRRDRAKGHGSGREERGRIRLERDPYAPGYMGRGAEPLVRPFGLVGPAAGGDRPCDHLRRHGRHQHGAWRDGDARRLFDLCRADASAAVAAELVARFRHSARVYRRRARSASRSSAS